MIPEKFFPEFNDLLAAARAWEASDRTDSEELTHIESLQSAYTKGVECKCSFSASSSRRSNAGTAYIRHLRKAGLQRAPADTKDAVMACFGVLSRLADTMDGIYDVLRYNVRPSFSCRSGTDSWQSNLPPIVRDEAEDTSMGGQ
jgi:hypothetical protein